MSERGSVQRVVLGVIPRLCRLLPGVEALSSPVEPALLLARVRGLGLGCRELGREPDQAVEPPHVPARVRAHDLAQVTVDARLDRLFEAQTLQVRSHFVLDGRRAGLLLG